jgi:predicted nucleic acid-binding protein
MMQGSRVWFTPFHLTECVHAIVQQVFQDRIRLAQAEAAYADLKRDLTAGVWLETAVPEQAFTVSADLAERYGSKLGMRTLDSLHVACALELKAERFWTFDERQAKLAKAVGMKVIS